MQFVADLEPNDDGALQIMYGIDGRRDLTESTRDDLSGYAGAQPGAGRQRRLRPAPERRLRRGARLDPAAHAPQRAAAAAAVADRAGAGRVRDRGLARARPGHLGGARRAAALRVLEADVLGGAGPRGEARRRSAATRSCRDAVGRRRPRRSGPTSSSTASSDAASCASTTTPTRSTPRRCWRRSSASCPATTSGCGKSVAGDRRRADRGRLRAALPRPTRPTTACPGKEGTLPDLLVLARLGAGDHRRAAARPRPDGAAAARRLAARPLRRGVRRRHRPPPRQLPAGVLAPGADRGGRADHPRRAAGGVARE